MYNEIVTRIPRDEAELWKVLWEQFEYVRHVLWDLDVETKEEALAHGDDPAFRHGMGVIRYRDTGEQLDQRDHFLAMARDLLPYIHQSLDEKKLTPEFVQQWGKVMFCHGYIASYVFDDTDDLLPERNRRKGTQASRRDAQHVFLAQLILWFIDTQKQPRKQAEASAANAISKFIDTARVNGALGEYDHKWFESLLGEGKTPPAIVSTMSQRKCGEDELRDLAARKVIGLPAVEMVVRSA